MPMYPGAVIKNVPRFQTKMTAVRLNLHTAASNATSLYSYFATPGQVCSHFYVRADGTVEQYVNTDYRAAADLQGNPDTISIETWDGYGSTWVQGQAVPAWTNAQVVALRNLVGWILDTHPSIPRKIATDSKVGDSSHGVSWHLLGVPASYAQLDAEISQTGGMLYSRSVGKICPGSKRIAQIPSMLTTTATQPITQQEDEMTSEQARQLQALADRVGVIDQTANMVTQLWDRRGLIDQIGAAALCDVDEAALAAQIVALIPDTLAVRVIDALRTQMAK